MSKPQRLMVVLLALAIPLTGTADAASDDEQLSTPSAVRRVAMDYGSLLTYTVGTPSDGSTRSNSNIALKGLCVRLGASNEAAICFDTDLLRYYAGWTGGFLDLSKTHLTSYKGSYHALIQGDVKVSTKVRPGWSPQDDFNDPRQIEAGPLPAEWGKFKGVFRHGNDVVFRYSMHGSTVFDYPTALTVEGTTFFIRTISVDAHSQQFLLGICDLEDGKSPGRFSRQGLFEILSLDPHSAVRVALSGVNYHQGPMANLHLTHDRRVQVILEPFQSQSMFRVILWRVPDPDSTKLPSFDKILPPFRNPEDLCHGGPLRWPDQIVTKGRLGTGAGPYLVDTVTLPENNPWHSWMRLTAFDFFSDGRAAVTTWNGDVWIVSGLDDKLDHVTWKRFAAGLFEPLGLKIVNDQVFVLCRDQLMRLRDLNGDDEADSYECINNDTWLSPSYHGFAFELQTDRAGNFYYIRCGQRVDPALPLNGAMVKVARDGSRAELFATGLRAANGMSIGPHDEITCADNQGNWIPSSRINWVQPGGFYGYLPHARRMSPPTDSDEPLCWLPMSIDNSSGGQVWVTSDRWGPFAGQLLHTSYGKASLFLVLIDDVDGHKQGGVVQFPLKFDSGIMRARFHPRDGQLWVCGLKGWQTAGARDGALQRVRYTGGAVRMPCALHVASNGVNITFTAPLDEASANDEQNYAAEQWNYAWTEKYGSPDFSVAHPDQQGHDPVTIKSAKLSADRKTVFLEMPALRPVMQMKIQFRLKSADDAPIAQTIYNTINRVPGHAPLRTP